MKKILLVYPPLSDNEVDLCIPNGVLVVGSVAKQAGYEVKIILPTVDITTELRNNLDWADIVGFSVMSPQVGGALALTKMVKKLDPNKTVVWGGVHCTLYPEQTSKSEYIDFVFTGECDETFVHFLNTGSLDTPGLWFKGHGNPPPAPVKELPVIDYTLVDMELYFSKVGKRVLEYYSGRSCPYQCRFCINMRPEFRNLRKIPKERAMNELKELIGKYDIEHVQFRDDYFIGKLEEAKEILSMLGEFKITWLIDARADDFREGRIDDTFLEGIGYGSFAIGFESGSDEILKYINKWTTVTHNMAAYEFITSRDMGLTGTFMYCMPPETREDVLKTAKTVHKFMQYKHSDVSASVFRPYPGNGIYDDCVRDGFTEPQSLEEWAKFDFLGNLNVDIPWKKDKWFVEFANFFQTLVYFNHKKMPIITQYLNWRFKNTNMLKRAPDMWAIRSAKLMLHRFRAMAGNANSVATAS